MKEAQVLFSPVVEEQYAFGETDKFGTAYLASFAARADHRCEINFMPMEGRVYFTRSRQSGPVSM